MNLIGTPVTARMESAAPPRASPSILVRIEAGERQRAVEVLGDAHRLLAGHGVGDEQDLVRLDAALDVDQLLHQRVVDLQAAGGVDDDGVVAALCSANWTARLGELDRVLGRPLRRPGC